MTLMCFPARFGWPRLSFAVDVTLMCSVAILHWHEIRHIVLSSPTHDVFSGPSTVVCPNPPPLGVATEQYRTEWPLWPVKFMLREFCTCPLRDSTKGGGVMRRSRPSSPAPIQVEFFVAWPTHNLTAY